MVEADVEPISKAFLLTSLRHAIDRLELEFAAHAAEFARGDEWDAGGYSTPADWLRFNCHMTSGAAWNALAIGARIDEMPATAESFRAGDIGYAHIACMANTASKVEGFDETKLLPLAVENSPGKFYFKCLHYRHSLNADEYANEQEKLAESRALYLSTGQDGHVFINGVLDPLGGAAVRSALEPLARPSGDHDDRTLPVRMADALVEQCSAGRPAHVQVTATLETLRGLAGAAGAEMESSPPVSSHAVRRMACDGVLTRVLLNQESLIIDVGRSRRVISRTLRKALTIRDGHCGWPGCERPASWCDGHHIVHWADGGETNLGNLVLLCRRHHRMVHEGRWQLVRSARRTIAVAPTVTFGLPRGPDWGR